MTFWGLLLLIVLPIAVANPFWPIREDEGEDSHPEEQGNLFEGDMVITTEQENAINGQQQTRDTILGQERLWTNNVMPFIFDEGLNNEARAAISNAMSHITTRTDGCINFVQRTNEASYVRFFQGNGCFSNIGRIFGNREQRISIGPGCEWLGIAVHEILHALGFFHEQSRIDRDDFVKVNFENIREGFENNFEKYQIGQASTLDVPYDYDSIMHYSGTAFSTDRRALLTIETKDPNDQRRIGQRSGLSTNDVRQIKLLYRCAATTQAPPQPSETDAPSTMAPEEVTDSPATMPPEPTDAPLEDPCSSYRELDSADRSVNSGTDLSDVKTDDDLEEAWYRITGAAGNQLARRPPRNQLSCGTILPGWVYLPSVPTPEEGPTEAIVCFKYYDRNCVRRKEIMVANCGDFLVYKLGSPPLRNGLRYCGSP